LVLSRGGFLPPSATSTPRGVDGNRFRADICSIHILAVNPVLPPPLEADFIINNESQVPREMRDNYFLNVENPKTTMRTSFISLHKYEI
jgi:hypothetical protein